MVLFLQAETGGLTTYNKKKRRPDTVGAPLLFGGGGKFTALAEPELALALAAAFWRCAFYGRYFSTRRFVRG